MKPLYLEIEGVKSISQMQSVDFERVAKSGIFGIFGKTGSGKTTILDSIVLAIYGDTTASVDNKDFVNTGCNRARVLLVFSVVEFGERNTYKVERIYKFDKKRVNLTSSATLYKVVNGVDFPIAENTAQVNNKLEKEIIGLEKKDFLKCIALPQGAFSDFIKQKRAERLTFVGKLFGLEKYGKPLADKIKAKDNQLKESENLNRGELTALEEYNDEYLVKSKKELDEVKLELEGISKKANETKIKYDQAKIDFALIQERNQKNEAKAKKLAYKPVIEGYIREIELYDSALFAKKEIEIYQTSEQNVKRITSAIKEFDEGQKTLASRKAKIYNEYKNLPLYQEELYAYRAKKEIFPELQTKMGNLEKKKENLIKAREDYKRLNNEKQLLLASIEESEKQMQLNFSLAEKHNPQEALKELSNSLSKGAIAILAKRESEFLLNLLSVLKSETLKDESAVNRLIDGEIAYLRSLIKENDAFFEGEKALVVCKQTLEKNREYTKKAQDFNATISSLKERLIAVNDKLSESLKMGTALKEECDLLEGEIKAVTQGKPLEEVLTNVNFGIIRLEKKIFEINEEFEKVNVEINESAVKLAGYNAELATNERAFVQAGYDLENKLLAKGITLQMALDLLSRGAEIEKNRITKDTYLSELSALDIAIGELNEKLKDVTLTSEEFEKIGRINQENQEKLFFINKKLGEFNRSYEIGLKKNQEWCIINKKLLEILQERSLLSKVLELVKESRFMEFIAEVYLREIAREAENRVLSLTSGRYGLVYDKGNFFVIDNLNGGKQRPVLSLSGGETFLVSLSLALALSSQISRKASKPLEFFFLDEGFGTLDDDLIDAVTTSLEKLQQSNLTVGLITHVAELKNRIASRIEVTGATALYGTVITST